ncbi:MAG: 6,7-dimethyl-8-ribityllumazine synthase [Alphaproteobacteria bacterium]|nr:6,7-dimethyl-8-ribityllumazine synthase [Alphaproteobacteria bacterium]
MSKAPHILIVESSFYADIAAHLRAGAVAALERAGASHEIIQVPGALEIPAAIKIASKAGKYDGYVALGCVIRGETSHYDIVAGESARAIMDLTVHNELAIGNGILTCETKAQAIVRADPAQKNKGQSAVGAALTLIELKAGR